MGGLARRSGGSADSERPRLGGWNGHAQGTPNGRVPQEQGIPGTQEAQAWSISLLSSRDSATCGEPGHDFTPCRDQNILVQDLRNGHLVIEPQRRGASAVGKG